MLLVVALCGSRLGSYVRHFGFCLKPVIKCVTVYSSALLVQLVSAASDLFLRAQREPLPPLEAFGVELAWVSWGPPMARSPVARLCARLPVEKRAASFRWVCTEERFCVGGKDDPRLPSTYVRSLSTPERTDDFYDELFPGGKYTRVVQGTPSKTSAGTFRFSSDRRSTLLFRRSTLST